MATTFSLQVITANRIFYDGRANMIILPGTDGEIGIMPHHENMVVAVTSGVMRVALRVSLTIVSSLLCILRSVLRRLISTGPRRPRSVLRSVFVRSRALRSTICRRHLLQGRWRGLRKPGRCTLRVIEVGIGWRLQSICVDSDSLALSYNAAVRRLDKNLAKHWRCKMVFV